MHEREAGTGLVEAEQIQLPADDPVVPAFGLLDPIQIVVEVLPGGPGRAVDPLEHLLAGVAVPVRARHGQDLERADPTGTGHVGATAQVLEPDAVRVEADRAALGPADIVRLVGVAGQLGHGLLAGHLRADERPVGLGDLVHFLFDPLEVRGTDRFIQVDVVVEAVFHGRPVHQPGRRPESADGLGHDVGAAVPHDLHPLLVLGGDDLDRGIALQDVGKVHDGSVDLARDGGLG